MEVQEDVVDTFLRYGLFLGAVFQLVCIGAVILMPDTRSIFQVLQDQDFLSEESSDPGSPTISPHHRHHKKRDKKKRR